MAGRPDLFPKIRADPDKTASHSEIIGQLLQQVALAAGENAGRRFPMSTGDKIECGVDGVGTLKVSIGNPE